MALTVPVIPLSQEAFAPFGSVIEVAGRTGREINDGRATRYHRLADIDAASQKGTPVISIFRARACTRPVRLTLFERHPLGSQSFVPLAHQRFVAVVGDFRGDVPTPERVSAFLTNGQQGVHYRAGTWHHPLLNLSSEQEFLVIDRDGPGNNCDEMELDLALVLDDHALGAPQ